MCASKKHTKTQSPKAVAGAGQSSENCIIVRGARMHNLKNIDIDIPRNKLVVITGVSGSGKSSLAFDTIYAEGQRRYVESLSAYARQFLELMEKPDVDSIEGLSPAISIEQRSSSRNPRSTVGTVTEIYDYLRVLFARIGQPHCKKCGRPISAQTITQMVQQVMRLPEGKKIAIFAPVVTQKKGEYEALFSKLLRQGFVRARVDGVIHELSSPPSLEKNKKHNIELFIDRLTIKAGIQKRLVDSISIAIKEGAGVAIVYPDDSEQILLSEKHACPFCEISFPQLTPQLFSFNNPKGACPACEGLGVRQYFSPDLVIPNKALSLREGAVAPWNSKTSNHYINIYLSLAKHYKFDIYTPFSELPQNIQKLILYGSGNDQINFSFESSRASHRYSAPFPGVIPDLEKRWKETSSEDVRTWFEKFMTKRPCPTCKGTRLKEESLSVKINEKNIAQICEFSISEAHRFMNDLKLSAMQRTIAKRLVQEIQSRLKFLTDVGLDYLTISRSSATLAGGEDQRIRLANQIGSALTGVLYVLDEPSIGLHQRDNHRLIETLIKLRDMGNTVLVVEHDRDTMLAADHIIDLGPGAGIHGGKVIAQGKPHKIIGSKNSLTGAYLSGLKSIEIPSKRRKAINWLTLKGAREHNLKNIDVEIPLGCFTCITGVSGSGKSTLITEILLPALKQRLLHSKEPAGEFTDLINWQMIDKVIDIDQSPIGRTPRSNPATYTGIFTPIRDLFTLLPESKARGYKPGRFSFNVKGGRCEACEGDGTIRIEMQLMPDVYVKCDQCQGKRFNQETLEIKYKGKNISEILDLTVSQASIFFENIPAIKTKLERLKDVGLGYIELGQAATTLSGGEAQRIKLSKELAKFSTGQTLYILDEPTTGLHFDDIQKLLDVLDMLISKGNSVIIIEHNLDVIKHADYCIDLGPEGGEMGGNIVAVGTPEEISQNKNSFTGNYLKGEI